jgi:hypothetical protein
MFFDLIKKRERKEKRREVPFVLARNYCIILKKIKFCIKGRDYSMDEFWYSA